MGEIRTDDEKVLLREIRFQHIGDLLQDFQPLGADDDGYDRRDLLENQLQERQLDFQAVFPVMGIDTENEGSRSPVD